MWHDAKLVLNFWFTFYAKWPHCHDPGGGGWNACCVRAMVGLVGAEGLKKSTTECAVGGGRGKVITSLGHTHYSPSLKFWVRKWGKGRPEASESLTVGRQVAFNLFLLLVLFNNSQSSPCRIKPNKKIEREFTVGYMALEEEGECISPW